MDLIELSTRLRRARVYDHGHTVADAARAVGASRGTWYRWEVGVGRPSAQHLRAIAEYLSCDPHELDGLVL